MPRRRTITLTFDRTLDDARGHRKELRDGLSTVLQIGSTLWIANDESASVERLSLAGSKAAGHVQFRLQDLLDLPEEGKDGQAPEIDIEGMDWADGYLWLVGSHSRKRCKPDADDPPDKAIQQLARTHAEANRFVLARIPLHEQDGLPALVRKDKPRRAQRLRSNAQGNALIRFAMKDKHLRHFVGLPGKENGFDIEGLAVSGERVFLGLRGPVLGGWAMVLELRPAGQGKWLKLAPVDGGKERVRKHFLDLQGLGIRDLCLQGDDLLVLAGPTMGLDGPVRVLRWRGAGRCDGSCVVQRNSLQHVLEIPPGEGCDHAEGITLFDPDGDKRSLLVVYDSPARSRQVGASGLVADVFELPA